MLTNWIILVRHKRRDFNHYVMSERFEYINQQIVKHNYQIGAVQKYITKTKIFRPPSPPMSWQKHFTVKPV